MWSDTLLQLERAHLISLLIWGCTSALVGTALLAWTAATGRRSLLLSRFGLQTCGWGVIALALAATGLFRLTERDLTGATRLDRLTWLSVGLDLGLLCLGTTLAVCGWLHGRRLGAVGSGIGIAMQGSGLLFLHVRFLLIVSGAL
jgi:hypothetical protein